MAYNPYDWRTGEVITEERLDHMEEGIANASQVADQSAADITVQTARIDEIESLPEGSTSGDAALNDIKIGYDGTVYNSPGEAVREQIEALHTDLDNVAKTDGFYEEMTVGNAEQLLSTQYTTDKVPYLYRTSGGTADIGNSETDKIVGGTINWNQLVQNGDFTDGTTGWTGYNGDIAVNNDTLVWTMTAEGTSNQSNRIRALAHVTANHVYVLSSAVKCSNASATIIVSRATTSETWWSGAVSSTAWTNVSKVIKPSAEAEQFTFRYSNVQTVGQIGDTITIGKTMLIDLTAMFGSAVADAVYAKEQANAGAGVAWFKAMFAKDYYAYNAGEMMHVSGLASHDMVGFNQWDEEWEVGTIGTDGADATGNYIRSKGYIPVFPNTDYYFNCPTDFRAFRYDANKGFINYTAGVNGIVNTGDNCHYLRFRPGATYGTTYKNDICINLSWSGTRNGEYEPYSKHSYALDSTLTLRGIPKVDANGDMYYEGDTYASDGTVTRNFKEVLLGDYNWAMSNAETGLAYTAGVTDMWYNSAESGTSKHGVCMSNDYVVGASDKGISCYYNTGYSGYRVFVTDSALIGMTGAQVKEYLANKGTKLIYKVATPTTEQATPYTNPQFVEDWGTEQYVTTGIVPVGHETKYPANLRDKLQHLPDLAEEDGAYLITQTGTQMSLTLFRIPKAENLADGTYVLKATVSGGTPTYEWVLEGGE